MLNPLTRNQVVVLVLVVAIGGGVFIWDNYFRYNPEKVYAQAEKKYIAAMTADTYGGKTPQETLDLFVSALRAEDIDLASKYFLLDKNLSRDYAINILKEIKDQNLLKQMTEDINKAKPDSKNRLENDNYKFIIYDNFGKVGARISLYINKYSNVWKIESI